MKCFNYLFVFSLLFVLLSCENEQNLNEKAKVCNAEYVSSNSSDDSMFKITESKALEYANIVFNRSKTRAMLDITLDYVVEQPISRATMPDTLAYIFNRGENEGFVVISADSRINPLLAFSEKGHFDNNNEVVNDVFISKLGAYIDENADNDSVAFSEDTFESCYAVLTNMSGDWHQRYPWNSVVTEFYPSCLVGCVPLTTAMIMTHCKETLTYHGVNFPLARMGAGIDRRVGGRIVGGSGGNVLPTITSMPYDSAVNYAAQLLYFIGIDLNTTYGTTASSASSNNALVLLRNLGFTLRHSSFVPFDIDDVSNYIQNGNIIYAKGQNALANDRHAWVIDGMGYCVDPETNEITDRYFNCVWGWGGNYDGFYFGDLFYPIINETLFIDVEYFAIDKFDFTVI